MFRGPSLSSRLANIQHMPVLITATVASDKPTDGFLIKDVVKISYESPQSRAFLQEYLLNMLVTSRNVYVKIKVLRLLQCLVEDGHIEFKQNLRKQPEPINEASKLRPLNPGDSKMAADCGRIRDMASKLLDTLYAETPELRRPAPEYLQASLLKEEGSGEGAQSRITGFGNTSISTRRTGGGSTSDKLKSLFGSTGKSSRGPLVYDPNYATMDPVPHSTGTSGPFTPQISSMTQSYQSRRYMYQEGPALTGSEHQPGRAGGDWGKGGGGGERRDVSLKSEYQRVSTPQHPELAAAAQEQEQQRNGVAEQLEQQKTEQERRLVEDITAPGGVRAAPPKDSMNTFINRCKALDCLAVVDYLRLKLQSDQSQVVLRTLFVIEALLRSDIPDISSFLDLTLDELNQLSSSPQSSIKSKSAKILRQLLATQAAEPSEGYPSPPRVTKTGAAVTGSIVELGGEGGEESQPAPPPTKPVEQPPAGHSEMASIFNDMTTVEGVHYRPSPPTAPRAVVRPTPKPQPARQQTPQANQPTANVFDDLLSGSGPMASLPSASEPPASQQDEQGEQDDALVDFGEDDDEFDPLKKRTSSFTRSGSFTRTGSFTRSDSLSRQLQGLNIASATPATTTSIPPPLQPQQSGDFSSQLVALDLSSTGGPAITSPPYQQQQVVLQPIMEGASPSLGVAATSATYGAGGGAYAVGPGAPSGGVVYSQHGVPMMYAPSQGMVYVNQPRGVPVMGQLGGHARPVQRPLAAKGLPQETDSGFVFLGKSSKGSAFDFVQDEMASHMKK